MQAIAQHHCTRLDCRAPEETRALVTFCSTLEGGVAFDECARMHGRPHLWERASVQVRSTPGQHVGPGQGWFAELVSTAAESPPFRDIDPELVPCGDELHTTSCQLHAAAERFAAGERTGAVAACRGLEEGLWQQECFFRLANAAAESQEPRFLEYALQCCLVSGSYAQNCLSQVAGGGSDPRHVAASSRGADLERLTVEHQAIAGFGLEPALVTWLQAMLWDRGLASGLARDVWLLEDTAAGIPSEAMPFLRAFLATRLWAKACASPRGIQAWSEAFSKAWSCWRAGRDAHESCPDLFGEGGSSPVIMEADLWRETLAEEQALTAIPYGVRSRRVLHEDPGLDGLVTVLEAAARAPCGDDPSLVLVEALAHEDPLVAWTAARLLQQTGALTETLAARVERHPSALVRGRAHSQRGAAPSTRRDHGPPAHR